MGVISIRFGQSRYNRTLHEVRLEPSDVAQEVLIFLIRKTDNGSFRLDVDLPLTLLQAIYTSVFRFVCSAVQEAKRRHSEVSSTDYFTSSRDEEASLEAHSRSADAAEAVAIIRDPAEAEDYVIGGIVTSSEAETKAVNDLWLYVSDRFCNHGHIPTFHDLPDSLRSNKDVSVELHARITARLIRYVRDTIDSV